MPAIICAAMLLMLSIFTLAACKRQHATIDEADIKTFTSGDLRLQKQPEVPATLYIDAHNTSGALLRIPENLAREMADNHFHIVSSPTDAGYILHITILREGLASGENLQRQTAAGYGSHVQLSGDDGQAVLADALLVQRRVPTAKREHTAILKNVSARNALESAQMRIGILAAGDHSDAAHDILFRRLAQALRMALTE